MVLESISPNMTTSPFGYSDQFQSIGACRSAILLLPARLEHRRPQRHLPAWERDDRHGDGEDALLDRKQADDLLGVAAGLPVRAKGSGGLLMTPPVPEDPG